MNSEVQYLLGMLLVTTLVTFLLRAFPFLLFGTGKKPNPVIAYIGRVLSPAAITMLVVYCFGAYIRDRELTTHFYGLAELLAASVVVGLQLWKKNPLLSIIAGTIVYMVLVQTIIP